MLSHSVDKRIRMVSDFQAGQLMVAADASQIQSVIMNLALNARDAMPGGGTMQFSNRTVLMNDASALAEGMEQGEYLVVSVSDTAA
jgi:two-component system cell cycle sensor histidine kinase/response regulator CckA